MRRCGHNPTDIEVSDIINKIHDDTGSLSFEVRSVLLACLLIINSRISTTSWRKELEIQIRRQDTRWSQLCYLAGGGKGGCSRNVSEFSARITRAVSLLKR